MPYTNTPWSRSHMETLVNVATTLADLTASAELCTQIPQYLSDALHAEPITLAVIRCADSEPAVAFISSSGQVATGDAAPTFNQNILDLHRQTRPLAASEAPMLRHAFANHSDSGFADLVMPSLGAYPRALVFSRVIDTHHRLLLVLHHQADSAPASATSEMLVVIASQLAHLFRCIMNWHDQPSILGAPFDLLTEREWTVLRALNSEHGEKQLADRLNLSPHTLHSHIKSIYRKIGVQGRLPLLLRLQRALRELRCATVNSRAIAAVEPGTSTRDRAVAVG